ncbi:hypothetical protein [Streptomyces rishiriensis]|nr:hypothetical protein [Streptomyces rishiriensis]
MLPERIGGNRVARSVHLVDDVVLLTHWDSVICVVTAEGAALRRRGEA